MSHPSPRRRSAALACLAALGFVGATQAADLTLFERPNFGGAQVTLRGWTPDIRKFGFNDRASSMAIESGRWEICSDIEFKGTCVTVGPGEYPALDRVLNDRISSAREVGTFGDRRGPYSDWGRGEIQLFGRSGFDGRSVTLESDSAALARNNFDDRASSVVVTRGTWELCSEPDYRGDCRTFAPGRYADLGYGMAREISSARLVRSVRDAPVVVHPSYPPPGDGPARAILFRERGLKGQSLAVSGPVNDLSRSNFGNAVASMIVESGTWVACQDAYFRGECRTFGPGRYNDNQAFNFLRQASSIRPGGGVAPQQPPQRLPPQEGPPGVELFSDALFRGDRVNIDRPTADLSRANFNNRAESAIVRGGSWEVCSDADYGGSCLALAPGRYPNLGSFGREVSSLRRVQ